MCEVETNMACCEGFELTDRKYMQRNATASTHTAATVIIITTTITTAVTKA